jgi:hypothetical protein
MRIRGIDSDGDWLWGQGLQSYRDGEGAIEEDMITRLRSWKNDCFFDLAAGIDWYNLLGSSAVKEIERQIFRMISGVDGVNAIESIEATRDTASRRLSLSIRVNTIYGTREIGEIL